MTGKRLQAKQDPAGEAARLRRRIAELKALDGDRKKTEEKLRESEEKYKTITNAATAAIVMIDDKGLVTFRNPAAEKIFGYSAGEAVGRELHLLMAPEKYHARYKKGFRHFRSSGEGPYVKNMLELTAVRRDGTEFPIGLSLSAIKIKGQWHSIGIIRDITRRKKAEEALLRVRDELEKRVAQRTAELPAANRELEAQTRELAEANTALLTPALLPKKMNRERSSDLYRGEDYTCRRKRITRAKAPTLRFSRCWEKPRSWGLAPSGTGMTPCSPSAGTGKRGSAAGIACRAPAGSTPSARNPPRASAAPRRTPWWRGGSTGRLPPAPPRTRVMPGTSPTRC